MKILLQLSFILLMSNQIQYAQSSWYQQTNPLGFGEQAAIGKVHFVNSTEGWIACGNGGLLHTTNAGSVWNFINPFPDDTISRFSDPAINMSWINQTHGWIIGTLGTLNSPAGALVYYTTNSGASWQKKILSTETGTMGIQIQFIDENIGWALLFNFSTHTATTLKTIDGGNSWTTTNGQGIYYFVNSGTGWAYTGSGNNGSQVPFKIYKTTNGGANWIQQFEDNVPGKYNAIFFSDANNGWVVGDSGKVLKTTNSGTNWSYITNSGVNISNSCKTVFFLDNNIGWISSKANDDLQTPILQHTNNGGLTWSTIETPFGSSTGVNAIFSMHFIDENNGWITADLGRIGWYTSPNFVEEQEIILNDFKLFQNYPNPFSAKGGSSCSGNPRTTIRYQLPQNGMVILKVYDVLGAEVATLVNEEKLAGKYQVTFDASNLSSGVYYYKLQAGFPEGQAFTQTRKMIVIR